MIRFLRAFAWLRWRLLANTFRRSRRRDASEWTARILRVLVPALLLLLLVPGAIGLGILGWIGGTILGGAGAPVAGVVAVSRTLLGAATLLVVFWPLVQAAQGTATNLDRLLLLPVPRGALHLVEVLAGFNDPFILVFLPGLVLLPAGMASGGAPGAAALALVAGLAFVAALVALSSLCAFALHLVLRDRRRAEALGLLFIVVIGGASFLPALFGEQIEARLQGRNPVEELVSRGPAKAPTFPAWSAAFPSELHARAVARAAQGDLPAGAAGAAGLLAEAAILFGISQRVHRRLLETPEVAGRRGGARARPPQVRRLPFLGPAASAVALAQVRTFSRTVRGRLSLFFTPLTVVVLALVISQQVAGLRGAHAPIGGGMLLAFLGMAFATLGLQPLLLNLFATDRAGLTLEVLAPLSDRDLVQGKLAGAALLAAFPAALCTVIGMAGLPGGDPRLWLATLLGGASVFLLFAPAAALLSLLLPRRADLGSMGTAGNPHPAASFIGMALTLTVMVPPAALAAGAVLFGGGAALACLLVAGWTLLAGLCGWGLTRLAVGILAERREALLLAAEGR